MSKPTHPAEHVTVCPFCGLACVAVDAAGVWTVGVATVRAYWHDRSACVGQLAWAPCMGEPAKFNPLLCAGGTP